MIQASFEALPRTDSDSTTSEQKHWLRFIQVFWTEGLIFDCDSHAYFNVKALLQCL